MKPPAHFPARRSECRSAEARRSGDLCSKRWIWEQYDYTVRTNTIVGPGGRRRRARQRNRHLDRDVARWQRPLLLSRSARRREAAVAECCRNLATTGALPVAATNNLNFGNPERPEIMAQLVEAIEGIAEACAFFETPITGGNVSLYNETLGEGDLPDAGAGHRRPDEDRAARADALSRTKAARSCCWAASAKRRDALRQQRIRQGGPQPAVGTAAAARYGLRKARARLRSRDRRRGLAESAHDLSDGGLGRGAGECCTGEIGASVDDRPANGLNSRCFTKRRRAF
jgi:phosphoribosylformylglycinamidine synthase subunit PurL